MSSIGQFSSPYCRSGGLPFPAAILDDVISVSYAHEIAQSAAAYVNDVIQDGGWKPKFPQSPNQGPKIQHHVLDDVMSGFVILDDTIQDGGDKNDVCKTSKFLRWISRALQQTCFIFVGVRASTPTRDYSRPWKGIADVALTSQVLNHVCVVPIDCTMPSRHRIIKIGSCIGRIASTCFVIAQYHPHKGEFDSGNTYM